MIKISIVIVCMNNLKNLYPCLDSIKKYTSISYETLVVAYLFSKENMEKLKKDYSWITIIESNGIRGFSENNNLALRQAKGEYCFVLNDDTEMRMPVIELLLETFNKVPEKTAIISPVLIGPDKSIQVCGRPPMNFKTFIYRTLHLWSENKGSYVNQQGIFKSYNIIGAAFLIKTELFREVGWFDETYFFCPEDIALSTKLNELGYFCYVNSKIEIIHYEGMSGKSLSMIQTATKPAGCRGSILFFSEGNIMKEYFLRGFLLVVYSLRFLLHSMKSFLKSRPNVNYVLAKGDLHNMFACCSTKTPKELFIKYYYLIKK